MKSNETCPHCGRKGEIPNKDEKDKGNSRSKGADDTPSDEEIQAGENLYLSFLETCTNLHDKI